MAASVVLMELPRSLAWVATLQSAQLHVHIGVGSSALHVPGCMRKLPQSPPTTSTLLHFFSPLDELRTFVLAGHEFSCADGGADGCVFCADGAAVSATPPPGLRPQQCEGGAGLVRSGGQVHDQDHQEPARHRGQHQHPGELQKHQYVQNAIMCTT
eukprot:1161480-Pelagomonas_calceolata.AAC.4